MEVSDVKDFIRSIVWQEILKDLKARREMITNLLIRGSDPEWTDDNMRGRISELDYLATTPEAFITAIETANEEQQKNADSENKEIEDYDD